MNTIKTLKHRLNNLFETNNIKFKKVFVNPQKHNWTLVIEKNQSLDNEQIIKNIKNIIPDINEIKIEYYKNNLENYMKDNKNKLVQFIKSFFPSASFLVSNNNWKIDQDRLIIPIVLQEDYNLISSNNFEKKIEQFIFETGNIKSLVLFEFLNDFNFLEQEIENEQGISVNNPIKSNSNKVTPKSKVILGRKIKGEIVKIISAETEKDIIIEGFISKVESKDIRNNKCIISYNITDFSSSITIKSFVTSEKKDSILNNLKNSEFVKVKGKIQFDNFSKENVLITNNIEISPIEKRKDSSNKKRVELHLHTQYSSMDAVSKVDKVIKRAIEFGHKAIAITDHGVLQAFPEAMHASEYNDIKIIYGLEGYLVDDYKTSKWGNNDCNFDDTFIVFDLETTGLSPKKNEIIEIGAVKVKNKQIIETFSTYVKPNCSIPIRITEITGITNNMVKSSDSIDKIMPKFLEFCGDNILVAHNAKFDTAFLKNNCIDLGIDYEMTVIDTLSLARNACKNLTRFNLKSLSKHFKINLENHHRALDDALATAKIYINLMKICEEKGANNTKDLNIIFNNQVAIKKMDTNHVIILVKNYEGLKNLYKIVSKSHLEYFYKKPRIPKSLLQENRNGLIIGTACESGELFKALLNDLSEDELHNIINFYDYLEIQPLGNNKFLIDNNTLGSNEELININKRIIDLGDKYNKPVIASGDVHFVDKEEEYYRRILMHGQGFSDAENQPPLYFRTTEEMLDEFSYLNPDKAEEVVITNTNFIADEIESILPIPNGTFPPIIEGSDEEITEMVMNNAFRLYGNPLPEIVKSRVDKELNSIIKNGYSVLYLIAHKLVKKSLDDGYLVGSRGSVGSSLVATLCDITEVNPLPPHYICPNCKKYEFFNSNDVGVGADLEYKNCPECNTMYNKDGFDIPFEVFLGFDGDKEPDIDLNFSGEYQPLAHKYTEELFGKGQVFRAGTISTIAERTAFGFVRNYLEETGKLVTNAEIERLIGGCSGIKKTTGQHPGGIMVVPNDKEIFDFCPIQKPADDPNSETITTHFDYHSISGRLLKLDILGHDDPTVIKMLEDLTNVDAKQIPLDDEETMSIFTSNKALKLLDKDIGTSIGTYGIPEFGTSFVIQMLLDTKPNAFADLIRISGFSHGTDVWLNNAQELVKSNTSTIKEVISTRDDIMVYLIYKGLPAKHSFTIMEKVRKGKGLSEDDVKVMKENNIPDWYIDSCNKIQYMFPKAHAAAYVTMAFRIAYFKVHYPLAYYATYFTVRANDFDAHLAVGGKKVIRKKICEIKEIGNEASTKEKSLLTVLELVLEMLCRGFSFISVDLYESHYNKFIIKNNQLLPPFNSLEGIGDKAAYNIYNARKNGEFISIEDLQQRTKISKTNIEILQKHGTINSLPQSNQISLF